MSDKEKILIADDSAMNRAILTEMLGDGYEILEAENGRQAVAILQSATDIDLLLLDIMMPEMDGIAATARRVVRLSDGKIIADHAQEVDWE